MDYLLRPVSHELQAEAHVAQAHCALSLAFEDGGRGSEDPERSVQEHSEQKFRLVRGIRIHLAASPQWFAGEPLAFLHYAPDTAQSPVLQRCRADIHLQWACSYQMDISLRPSPYGYGRRLISMRMPCLSLPGAASVCLQC